MNHLLVVMAPKHTGGLQLILSLKWFSCYIHISTFNMPAIRKVWQLIQQGDYAFPNDLIVIIK